MAIISLIAIFFVVWWVVLFAMLPLGVRTQDEEGDVTLGTTASAPARPRMLRTVLRTTVITFVIVGSYYAVTSGLGLTFDDIPRIVPDI